VALQFGVHWTSVVSDAATLYVWAVDDWNIVYYPGTTSTASGSGPGSISQIATPGRQFEEIIAISKREIDQNFAVIELSNLKLCHGVRFPHVVIDRDFVESQDFDHYNRIDVRMQGVGTVTRSSSLLCSLSIKE
jgi:hypothetical protein